GFGSASFRMLEEEGADDERLEEDDARADEAVSPVSAPEGGVAQADHRVAGKPPCGNPPAFELSGVNESLADVGGGDRYRGGILAAQDPQDQLRGEPAVQLETVHPPPDDA